MRYLLLLATLALAACADEPQNTTPWPDQCCETRDGELYCDLSVDGCVEHYRERDGVE